MQILLVESILISSFGSFCWSFGINQLNIIEPLQKYLKKK